MMKKIIYLTLISITMLIFSCETHTELGYNILPEGDILDINISDTTSVNVYTLLMDSIATNNVSILLLGEYIDPIFGYSKASFVCEYGLAEYPTFTDSHTIDSAVLYLTKDTINYYGNLSATHNITVYELNTSLHDTAYFADHDPSDFLAGEIIGQKSYSPDLNDSIIAITLSSSFAQNFQTIADVTTNDNFKDFFKGIYISSGVAGNDGAILKLNINPYSLIKVFFHNDNDTSIFNVTSNLTTNIRFNLFEHDYSSTDFYNNIGDETSAQDSVAYIQAMGGLRTKITFPSIEMLKDLGSIAINRAELVINTAPSLVTFDSDYPAIEAMILTAYDPENEYYLLPEYISGTSYKSVAYDDGSYKFDIAGYVRDILDGNVENNGLLLFSGSGSTTMKRTIITTGAHSNRMKLIISYTKL